MSDHEFAVEPRLRLILTDVFAVVRVRRGEPGTAAVTLTGGGEEYADALRVRFDATENLLDVREDPPQGVVSVTVAGGGVVVGSGNVVAGPGGVAAGGVRTTSTTRVASGGTVVTGVGGTVVSGGGTVVSGGPGVTVVHSGGRIVVNGVDVTDQVDPGRGTAGAPAEPVDPPVVTVVVPEGTDVGAERCADLTLDGVRGRVRATVAGQSRLVAREAVAARLSVTGVSRAELRRSSGPVALTVAGQSQVRLDGSFGDVGLELSGQSSVVGTGSFGRITGNASGMARVELSGPVEDEAVRTSGMASVRVGGPPPSGSATGEDWDF